LEEGVIAYKFLRADGTSVFTGFAWPLPGAEPGAWVDAPVDTCHSGIHACRPRDLPLWVGHTLYEAQLEGEIAQHATKVVASRGRLVRRVEAWDDALRAEYTRMCADRGHELAHQAGVPEWEQPIELSIPEGPALLGFVAARIAERASGREAYHAERARQTAWLAQRLGIPDV
jgi:hypothetical protein